MIFLLLFFPCIFSQSGDWILANDCENDAKEINTKRFNFTSDMLENITKKVFHLEADAFKIYQTMKKTYNKLGTIENSKKKIENELNFLKIEILISAVSTMCFAGCVLFLLLFRSYRLYPTRHTPNEFDSRRPILRRRNHLETY